MMSWIIYYAAARWASIAKVFLTLHGFRGLLGTSELVSSCERSAVLFERIPPKTPTLHVNPIKMLELCQASFEFPKGFAFFLTKLMGIVQQPVTGGVCNSRALEAASPLSA
jgi:hypothetical protein